MEIARSIAEEFALEGEIVSIEPYTGGHINDSFLVEVELSDRRQRYLLQRINTAIFRQPEQVLENIQRVTGHLAIRLAVEGYTDVQRRVLTLVPTYSGGVFCRQDSGDCWRVYRYIENTQAYLAVETREQAEQAGLAFGEFQRLLADLPAPRLHETITDFHNTPRRLAALEEAIARDAAGRVGECRAEIDDVLRRRSLATVLLDLYAGGDIPERVTHNDTKISNVLLDRDTDEALCVVDLDTVMPGLSLYDFGDMVRSMVTTTTEDETDLSKVEVELGLFEGLTRGYLAATAEFLTPTERAHLVSAGKLITFEQATRFLNDYLNGDSYYKISRPNHNLERARTQLKLLESIEQNEHEMTRLVKD